MTGFHQRGFVIFSFIFATLVLLPLRGEAEPLPQPEQRAYYRADVDHFNQLPIEAGDIVLAGDSIIARGQWHELLSGPHMIRVRGIDGDTVAGLTRRIGPIIAGQPAIIVLQIGNNDLMRGFPTADILRRYEQLVQQIRYGAPRSQVVITSLPPKGPRWVKPVLNFNDGLADIARRFQLRYVDLFPVFADRQRKMAAHLTFDLLHMNGAGYKLFAQTLAPVLPDMSAIK